ncbi:unnamed protein product [Nippostrongylus brasiliensis]|uniref:Tyrosine-protein kinase Fps85D (inferred by orthology to a D. melanogaster protein) n=1 Tax=Nippostrongylus brasiliensis TaxID=27835 RepID=A0A158QY13_NIPBR|nr:unnamed protein product [Nippostrongylus brasiliensis]
MIQYYVRERKPVTKSTEAILIAPIPKQDWEFKHEWIELGKKLGEGAFGGVYAGILTLNKQKFEVAVKVNKAGDITKKIIAEICKEARLMRRYSHPNEPVMLVMEMVSGGALDVFLQKNGSNITKKERLLYAVCAARGLDYLHENNCLHRDVAASDFGLSRELSNRAKKYRMKDMHQRLPIRWLAPEVLTTGTYSKKSDVYSFGILLWEIYHNGQIPYEDMSPAEVTASWGDVQKHDGAPTFKNFAQS